MSFKANISLIYKSKNFKHGILYTLFSFINSGISFILLLILAKYLTPCDYGYLNLFSIFITLLNIIIALCTTSYVTVSFFQKSLETLRQIILIVFGTASGMLILIASILLIIPTYIQQLIGVPIEYIWLGILICYLGIFNNVNLDIWRLEEKPIYYGFYGISFAVCNFILSFWLIVGLKYGWQGRVYAWVLLGIIYFIISVVFLIKRKYLIISRPSWNLIQQTFIYALPLLPHTASFWIKQGLDRYIINYYYDQTIVGYFSFAMNLAAIITIIGTAFNSTNSVYIYKNLSEGYRIVKSKLQKQTQFMIIAFILVTLLVGIFAYSLIIFFIPQYGYSIKYIFPLCMSGFFQCIYLLWVNYLFYYKKTKQLMNISFSTAILQVVLSVLLTRYSSIYTAYISMGISFLMTILVIKISKRVLISQLKNETINKNTNLL